MPTNLGPCGCCGGGECGSCTVEDCLEFAASGWIIYCGTDPDIPLPDFSLTLTESSPNNFFGTSAVIPSTLCSGGATNYQFFISVGISLVSSTDCSVTVSVEFTGDGTLTSFQGIATGRNGELCDGEIVIPNVSTNSTELLANFPTYRSIVYGGTATLTLCAP